MTTAGGPYRFLFCLPAYFTHLTTFFSITKRLEAEGHTVAAFSALDDFELHVRRSGMKGRAYVPTTTSKSSHDHDETLRARARDPAWSKKLRELARRVRVPELLKVLEATVRDFRPDVMVVNSVAFTGAIVAEQASIPWAAIHNNLILMADDDWCGPFVESVRALGFYPEDYFAERNLKTRVKSAQVVSPYLNIIFSTEELVSAAHVPEPTFCVGPSDSVLPLSDEPFPWDRLRRDRQIVYVAHGTLQSFPPHVYQSIIDAVRPSETQVVLALHNAMPELHRTAPEHVLAVRFVPQPALLEVARVMVSHGGANSMMEALGRGCPLLIVPLGYDSLVQAKFIERSGAGLALDPARVDVTSMRAALDALLPEDSPYRARARQIGASYRAHNGPARAAELIVDLARRTKAG